MIKVKTDEFILDTLIQEQEVKKNEIIRSYIGQLIKYWFKTNVVLTCKGEVESYLNSLYSYDNPLFELENQYRHKTTLINKWLKAAKHHKEPLLQIPVDVIDKLY